MKKLFASVFNFPLKWHHACNERDILTWLCLRHKKDRKRNRKEEKMNLSIFIIFRPENLVHGFYVDKLTVL